MSPRQKYVYRHLAIKATSAIGFFGLFACRLFEILFYENEREMGENPFWFSAIIVFLILFVVPLIVFLPIQILNIERKGRRAMPPDKQTTSDVIGIPFGAFNPNASVPKWISFPILALFWILLVALVLGLAMALIFG